MSIPQEQDQLPGINRDKVGEQEVEFNEINIIRVGKKQFSLALCINGNPIISQQIGDIPIGETAYIRNLRIIAKVNIQAAG